MGNSSVENASMPKLTCSMCDGTGLDAVAFFHGKPLCWLCTWLKLGIVI